MCADDLGQKIKVARSLACMPFGLCCVGWICMRARSTQPMQVTVLQSSQHQHACAAHVRTGSAAHCKHSACTLMEAIRHRSINFMKVRMHLCWQLDTGGDCDTWWDNVCTNGCIACGLAILGLAVGGHIEQRLEAEGQPQAIDAQQLHHSKHRLTAVN